MKIKLITPCFREHLNKHKTKYLKDIGKAKAQMKDPVRFHGHDLVMYEGEPMTRSKANALVKTLQNDQGIKVGTDTHKSMIMFAKSLGADRRAVPKMIELGNKEFIKMFRASEFNSKIK
jgi:hypothetical protein